MDDTSGLKAGVVEQLNELSDLALRGRSTVVNAAPIMLIWGCAILVAAICEKFSQSMAYTVLAWIVPVLLAYVGGLLEMRRSLSDGRAVTWRSRALHRIWVAAGTAIVVFNIGEALHRTGVQSESEAATALILSVAALASAELANRKSLAYVGIGWLVTALALLSTLNGGVLLLILALAAVALQIIPGILLLRAEWKA